MAAGGPSWGVGERLMHGWNVRPGNHERIVQAHTNASLEYGQIG